MPEQSINTKGDRILKVMNDLNRLAMSKTSVDVKCGAKMVLLAERENLIDVSDFFESMLALKPTEKEAVIDLTSFCADEKTLTSLIQFANLRDIVPFQWSISTIANMIFLVDPLQLTKLVEDELFKHLSAIIANPNALGEFVTEVSRAVTERQPTDVEIENIMTYLKDFELTSNDSNAIEAERADVTWRKSVYEANLIHGVYKNFPPVIVPTQLSTPERLPSLVILAVWMRTMSETLVFGRLADVLKKADVKIGEAVPERLKSGGKLDADLEFWIKLIYACGKMS